MLPCHPEDCGSPSRKLWHDNHGLPRTLVLPKLCVGKVIPQLNRMLIGMTSHVPNPSVSGNLTWHLEKVAKYYDSKKVVKQALEGGPIKGYPGLQ